MKAPVDMTVPPGFCHCSFQHHYSPEFIRNVATQQNDMKFLTLGCDDTCEDASWPCMDNQQVSMHRQECAMEATFKW